MVHWSIVLILAVGLAVALYFLLMGPRSAPVSAQLAAKLDTESKAKGSLEANLNRRKKDTEQLRLQLAETKEELKQAKRKLYEHKDGDKGGRDLAKARTEFERGASLQLEGVRAELATALTEIERLRSSGSSGPRRVAAPAHAPAPSIETPAAPPPQRIIRELSDADKEKMVRAEQEAAKARGKAAELDKDLRRLKGRVETDKRMLNVTKSELVLTKDKFRAIEKRLNRTLLERDLLNRAIKDLEKKTGTAAERTELTSDEIAAADKSVDERQASEAAASAAAAARAEQEAAARAEQEAAAREAAVAAAETAPASGTEAPGSHQS